MAAVYVTVDYFGAARRDRPPCDGCTPANDPLGGFEPSAMRVIGTSSGMNLCTRCARDVIKSIAARFMLYDPRSSHDLMDFFAVEASTPAPQRPRPARRLAPPDGQVDVLPPGTKVPKSAKKGTS
jgi:hypothetical protein